MPPRKSIKMKLFQLIAGIFLFTAITAQAQDNITIRQVWCEMALVTEPNVKEFKTTCEKIVQLFPSPQVTATYELGKKLYMNKMRGVMKRGATWDVLTVQARNELAKQAIDLTNEYLAFEAGSPNPQPQEFQRTHSKSAEVCMEQKYAYSDPNLCDQDCRYLYREGLAGPMGKSSVMSFWLVIRYVACLVDCDVK
jgi:hypothetical protein